jgi:hypothetical protein
VIGRFVAAFICKWLQSKAIHKNRSNGRLGKLGVLQSRILHFWKKGVKRHISFIARRIIIVTLSIVIMLMGFAPVLSDRLLQRANFSISFQEILNDPNLDKGNPL